jgi:hypothetical protein
MRPALDPAGHRVPRMKPTCLLHTWRPHQRRPFPLVLHLHHHQSSRNLHLQYLAKNQSTQRCQSLITQGSDHPPVLEPHMVLSRIDRRCPHSDRRIIRCYCLRCSSSAIHPAHLQNGPSVHPTMPTSFFFLRSVPTTPTLCTDGTVGHPTVSFLFLFFASSTWIFAST